jgi:hypothetical protein
MLVRHAVTTESATEPKVRQSRSQDSPLADEVGAAMTASGSLRSPVSRDLGEGAPTAAVIVT